MKYFFPIVSFLLFFSAASAQNAVIQGCVTDKVKGDTIIGAVIRVDSTGGGAQSDFTGHYLIGNIKPGTHKLTVVCMSYKTQVIQGIVLSSGQVMTINIQMESADPHNLGEVTIITIRQTNTINSVINDVKHSDNVVSAVGGDQIGKSQDRNAADALARIPGVTIIDGRFLMVRGLADRYSTVWLNDASTPGAETDKKSFSFDVIPAGTIDRMLIYKTASPDLPGDFAGGMVKIYTKAFPDKLELSVNYQASYRSGSTGNTFSYTPAASTGKWGFSNGEFNIPTGTPAYISHNDPDIKQISQAFQNTWGVSTKGAAPDTRFGITYAQPVKLKKIQLGSTTGISYTSTNTVYNIHRQDWDSTAQSSDFTDNQSTNTVRVAALQNFAMMSKHHKIELRSLLNQTGKSTVTVRNSNFLDAPNQRSYVEDYEEKTTFSAQLSGRHNFFDDKTMYQWTAGYAFTTKNTPDLKRITYYKQRNLPDSMYSAAIPSGTVDPVNGGGRFFSWLHENIYSFNHSLQQKITLKKYSFNINLGNYIEYKSREFWARELGYVINPGFTAFNLKRLPVDQIFDPSHVGDFSTFRMDEITAKSDKYAAQNELIASYLSFSFPIGNRIKVLTGVRHEYNVQSLQSFVNLDSIHPKVFTRYFLPTFNMTFAFKKDTSLLRFAYGKTVNRPEFREWSPFYFYDFDFFAGNYGSLFPSIIAPNGEILKVCRIDNYDLRYEYYPRAGEFIQLGVFYKSFADPIQQVIVDAGVSDGRAFTYTNAKSAYVAGAELDVRKNLAFLDDKLHLKYFFTPFSIVANFTYIQSQETMRDMPPTSDLIHQYPLQGQSPYVVNAGIYYGNDSIGLQASLLYNVFGPRLYLIGTQNYASLGELSRNTLDFSITKDLFKHFAITFAVQDIFNQPFRIVQDTNRDNKFEKNGEDEEFMSYKRGSYFTFGLKVKL